MHTGNWTRFSLVFLILAACITGTASATSLGINWKQSPVLADTTFSGVILTPDAAKVFSGGSQLLVRSWNGDEHWGGQAGFIATMSTDGTSVLSASGNTLTMLNSSGSQLWSKTMDGQIQAIALSRNASLVVAADAQGNYRSWNGYGDPYGRNTSSVARHLAVTPAGDLIVATTESGIRYYTPSLDPAWSDSRAGSLDEYIAVSEDGDTIITAGGSRLSSHTRTGTFNWQADVTGTAINDVACNEDCSLIVVGSQDNTVQGIDRYGKTHWTFSTGQWANAVALSRSGSVIAAGANDGTLFILNHNGNLQVKMKFDSRIQPRTLAVSRDGSRIAVADRYYLYGLTLSGNTVTETGSDAIFVAATLNPVPGTTAPAVASSTQPAEVTLPEEARPTATTVPAATKQSPAGLWIVVPAIGGALCLIRALKQ